MPVPDREGYREREREGEREGGPLVTEKVVANESARILVHQHHAAKNEQTTDTPCNGWIGRHRPEDREAVAQGWVLGCSAPPSFSFTYTKQFGAATVTLADAHTTHAHP